MIFDDFYQEILIHHAKTNKNDKVVEQNYAGLPARPDSGGKHFTYFDVDDKV